MTYISGGAFSGCNSLTSIKVDENNRYYDSREDCNAIIETGSNKLVLGCVSTLIPESVTSIGYCAFMGCSSLASIVIPKGVTSIVGYAFSGCSNLTGIVIPEGVTSIGAGAFGWCSSLASIVIPEGVTSIGNAAFEGCSSLTSIVIPEGVQSIGKYTFSECTSLASIVIPKSVTSISNVSLESCSSLTSFTCLATNPPLYDNLFDIPLGFYNSSIIYVPAASVDAYKAADGWRDYADQIQAIPE